MITLIRAIPPSFEEGYCPKSWREFALKLISETQFLFQSDVANSYYNYGDQVPSVDNRVFPWLRTVAGQNDRWYTWSPNYGAWIAPYWPTPDALFTFDWKGTEIQLKEVDNPGGSATPITATTGPFWEADKDFDGRSAIGAGLIPLSDPPVTLAVGDEYGAGSHLLSNAEIANHTHVVEFNDATPGATYAHVNTGDAHPFDGSIDEPIGIDPSGLHKVSMIAKATSETPAQVSLVHPSRAVIKPKRTARKYYAI